MSERTDAGSHGAALVAWGAISAWGEGEAAVARGHAPAGSPARCMIGRDAELDAAGLTRPFAARASLADGRADRATVLLVRALDRCLAQLDVERPGWRVGRIGLAVGTSSGGMRSAELLFRGEAMDPQAATYFGPLAAALAGAGLTVAPASLVLGACISGAVAVGLGLRWLEAGRCDLVLAGGFDAVSVFVASGFEALKATTATPPPRPFRVGRDGMALGEGAAILALAPSSAAPAGRAQLYVAGFGASCDATHVTAPERTGGGLARAARAALLDANVAPSAIDLVSPHATATPYNDAAEWRALVAVLGEGAAREVPLAPLKAELGHTLGAAGALESLAVAVAFSRGVVPGAGGEGPLDPDTPARLLPLGAATAPTHALKLACAFGGANAALVLTREPPPPSPRRTRAVYVTRAVQVTAAAQEAELSRRLSPAVLARADELVRLALTAVAALEAQVGSLAGAGIVVGHALATLETNALYAARLAARGARAAEPRRFPYTSPNAVCGECAVAFGLTGPAFATGASTLGALEALSVAHTLVAAGDAERIVVVGVDSIGGAAARMGEVAAGLVSGAIALVVQAGAEGAIARVDSAFCALGPGAPTAPEGTAVAAGHLTLAPLAGHEIRLPICLSGSSRGSFAEVRLIGVNE